MMDDSRSINDWCLDAKLTPKREMLMILGMFSRRSYMAVSFWRKIIAFQSDPFGQNRSMLTDSLKPSKMRGFADVQKFLAKRPSPCC